VQQVVLLTAGRAFMDMPFRGTAAACALVIVVTAAVQTSVGFAATAFGRSVQQVTAVANLGALLLAGIGGALTPVELLPSWVQTIAKISPVYWTLLGIRGVVIEGYGVGEVAGAVTVLGSISIVVLVVSIARYRHSEVKTFY
jgi:ABC-2 type transport system permease protein